jgi:hypothetical protein
MPTDAIEFATNYTEETWFSLPYFIPHDGRMNHVSSLRLLKLEPYVEKHDKLRRKVMRYQWLKMTLPTE